tara:strand:- start:342 stop:605 length:264 start_codon:yes stop_codon:yes gene_type:complete
MKKIFLIFTLLVSSYGFSLRLYNYEYEKGGKPFYEVCASEYLELVVVCAGSYLANGWKAQSGLQVVDTPEGLTFFQTVILNVPSTKP